jgi:transposase
MPTLPNNSVVTMDNATVHKGQNRVNALDWRMQALTLLDLPPYSPDLKPI